MVPLGAYFVIIKNKEITFVLLYRVKMFQTFHTQADTAFGTQLFPSWYNFRHIFGVFSQELKLRSDSTCQTIYHCLFDQHNLVPLVLKLDFCRVFKQSVTGRSLYILSFEYVIVIRKLYELAYLQKKIGHALCHRQPIRFSCQEHFPSSFFSIVATQNEYPQKHSQLFNSNQRIRTIFLKSVISSLLQNLF